MKITKKNAVLLSLALYVIACFTPALVFQSYQIDQGKKIMGEIITWYGWTCLMKGLMAVFVGQFAQFSNMFYLVALMMLQEKAWLTAAICSLFAVLVGFNTLALGKSLVTDDDAGVVKLMYLYPNIGFYLWMASFVVLLAFSVFMIISEKQSKKGLKEEEAQSPKTEA